jgi:hypothetical protein
MKIERKTGVEVLEGTKQRIKKKFPDSSQIKIKQ